MEHDYNYRGNQINASNMVYNDYGTEIDEDHPETYRTDIQGSGPRKRQLGGEDAEGAVAIDME